MTYFFIAIIALIVGSFLNLLIYRLPMMLETQLREDCDAIRSNANYAVPNTNHVIPNAVRDLQPPLGDSSLRSERLSSQHINLWFPRSFCPLCKQTISWLSNIPLLSYCIQKGRCRHCHQTISIRYPLVELLSLILCLYATFVIGWSALLVPMLLFIWFMIPLFFIDIQHQLLPDELTLGLLWIGLLTNISGYFCSLSDAVIGAVCAYLTLWTVTRSFKLLTGKTGMGDGDLKLFAAYGAWFGWQLIPQLLLISSLSGALVGLIYLKVTQQSKETPIPFGPFLCLAGLFELFRQYAL